MLKTFIGTYIPDFNSISSAVLEKKFLENRPIRIVKVTWGPCLLTNLHKSNNSCVGPHRKTSLPSLVLNYIKDCRSILEEIVSADRTKNNNKGYLSSSEAYTNNWGLFGKENYLTFDWWKYILKILRRSEVTINLTRRFKKKEASEFAPL